MRLQNERGSQKYGLPQLCKHICIHIRGVGCVNAPIRVYAPDAAYTRGRDERHVALSHVGHSVFVSLADCFLSS